MHEKAAEITKWISTSDSRYLSDDCPEIIADAVLRAGNEDTWDVCAAVNVLEAIRDGEIDPEDEDTIYDWADSVTEIYNHSLRKWFAEDGYGWYEEYLDEFDGSGDIHRDLMAAQCRAYERIAGEIVYAFSGWMEDEDR